MANKFLIIGSDVYMSKSVEYHSELAPKNPRGPILGGGWFHEDKANKTCYLYGSSHDFKTASKEQILTALENTMLSFYYDGWAFYISNAESIFEAISLADTQGVPDFTYNA